MLFFIAGLILLPAYYFLIGFYEYAYRDIPAFSPDDETVPDEKISVIIPARNEEHNIARCIHSLLLQHYPPGLLEIIVVDDHSTDNTAAIIRQFEVSGVKLISLSEAGLPHTVAFKKMAIQAGIDAASGSLIVTTDADCTAGPDWIKTIAAYHRTTGAVFIVAPVKIKPGRRVLSVFQSIDFAILQGITAAGVHTGFHRMCNGADLAYEREAFLSVNGFEGIDRIASGDDMLLMEKIAARYPGRIAYLNSASAIVETLPVTTWNQFFNQRIRWASKTGRYKDKRMLWVLLLVYFLNLCMAILLAGSFFNIHWLLFFLILAFYKCMIEWRFVKDVLQYFRIRQLMPLFPLFQPLHIIYTVLSGFFGIFGSYTWKERKYFIV
jgi:cellulose synthase/poly-beta-1,6-N-acetylglucosamine synthase-like glycosyltransferase